MIFNLGRLAAGVRFRVFVLVWCLSALTGVVRASSGANLTARRVSTGAGSFVCLCVLLLL